jgi:hypothetical protein
VKITAIGATGLIGTKVVTLLNDAGHQTAAAALDLGTNVLTGEGLADAVAGADALVDVTNPPTFETDAHQYHMRVYSVAGGRWGLNPVSDSMFQHSWRSAASLGRPGAPTHEVRIHDRGNPP